MSIPDLKREAVPVAKTGDIAAVRVGSDWIIGVVSAVVEGNVVEVAWGEVVFPCGGLPWNAKAVSPREMFLPTVRELLGVPTASPHDAVRMLTPYLRPECVASPGTVQKRINKERRDELLKTGGQG